MVEVDKEFKKVLEGDKYAGYRKIYEKEKKVAKKRVKQGVAGYTSLKGKSPSSKLSVALMKGFTPKAQKGDESKLAEMKLAHKQRMEYLKEVQRMKQSEANQLAMQQDPRFNQSSEDQFLAEQDPMHEMNVALAQQQINQQPQEQQQINEGQSMTRRVMNGFSQFGRGLNNLGSNLSKFGGMNTQGVIYDKYGNQRINLNQAKRTLVREPRLTAFSSQRQSNQNILKVGNRFNRNGASTLLLKRRYK